MLRYRNLTCNCKWLFNILKLKMGIRVQWKFIKLRKIRGKSELQAISTQTATLKPWHPLQVPDGASNNKSHKYKLYERTTWSIHFCTFSTKLQHTFNVEFMVCSLAFPGKIEGTKYFDVQLIFMFAKLRLKCKYFGN